VTRRGNYRVVLQEQVLGLPYAARDPDAFGREFPNVLLALKSKIIAPSRWPATSLIGRSIERTIRAGVDLRAPSAGLQVLDRYDFLRPQRRSANARRLVALQQLIASSGAPRLLRC
jgi:hypothetical protein